MFQYIFMEAYKWPYVGITCLNESETYTNSRYVSKNTKKRNTSTEINSYEVGLE